jgi:hypothetical protein
VLEGRDVPSTLTVSNNLDNGVGSLRAEITAAHSGDTIIFASSLNGQTINLTSGELLIKKNLTITGPGAGQLTLSGNHSSRVFELAAKYQLGLSGLAISNGDGVLAAGPSHTNDGYGGTILNEGTLTISNCTLSGNSASQEGGAIHNYATLTVSNSTLSSNTSIGLGGAIANDFGATLTLSGSTLSGNSATYGFGGGGAIATWGTTTVSGSTLSGNSANYGGGIYTGYAGGTTTINGCTLSANSAYEGGAIYDGAGTLNVSNSSLLNNSATLGGGIYNYQGWLTLSGSILTGNSATAAGGGIWVHGSVGPDGTVTVKNATRITGNSAPTGHGADVYDYLRGAAAAVLYLDSTSTIGILDGNPAIPI